MFRKRLLLDLGFLVICFLTLWLVSQHDRNAYQIQLEHGGLSQESVVFHSQSNLNMQQVAQVLTQKHYNNFQVQFIDPAQPHVSYVFAKHPDNTLSMVSGRNFATADFQSPLPFAIVGQNWAENLYKPQSHAYLENNGRFIAVIGQAGTSGSSALNDHRFITVSPLQTTDVTPIKNFQVVADGSLVLKHKQAFSKVIQATSSKLFISKTESNQGNHRWSRRSTLIMIYSLALIGFMTLTLLFYATMRQPLTYNDLDQTLGNKMIWGYYRRFALHLLLSSAIGYFLGLWNTYLISYRTVTTYIVCLVALALIFMLILLLRLRQKDRSLT